MSCNISTVTIESDHLALLRSSGAAILDRKRRMIKDLTLLPYRWWWMPLFLRLHYHPSRFDYCRLRCDLIKRSVRPLSCSANVVRDCCHYVPTPMEFWITDGDGFYAAPLVSSFQAPVPFLMSFLSVSVLRYVENTMRNSTVSGIGSLFSFYVSRTVDE